MIRELLPESDALEKQERADDRRHGSAKVVRMISLASLKLLFDYRFRLALLFLIDIIILDWRRARQLI